MLGPFKTFNTGSEISRPYLDIVDYRSGTVLRSHVKNECPDQIIMFGTVEPSNAFVTFRLQCGQQFPGLPQADWRIQGDKGSIRVTASALFLGMGAPDINVQVYDNTTGRLREEKVGSDEEFGSLPLVARNIGRLYEAFRKDEWVPNFDWALERQAQVERAWQQFDETHA